MYFLNKRARCRILSLQKYFSNNDLLECKKSFVTKLWLSPSHHCDQTPDLNYLKEKGLIWARGFGSFCLQLAGSFAPGSVTRWKIEVEEECSSPHLMRRGWRREGEESVVY